MLDQILTKFLMHCSVFNLIMHILYPQDRTHSTQVDHDTDTPPSTPHYHHVYIPQELPQHLITSLVELTKFLSFTFLHYFLKPLTHGVQVEG